MNPRVSPGALLHLVKLGPVSHNKDSPGMELADGVIWALETLAYS